MSHRIALITNWLYLKLEYILSAALGVVPIAIDAETLIIKLLLAFILGAMGAAGGLTFKYIHRKLIRK